MSMPGRFRCGDGGKECTTLRGMDEIAAHARHHDATILTLVKARGFPARKIGGMWVSDKGLIDAYWRDKVNRWSISCLSPEACSRLSR